LEYQSPSEFRVEDNMEKDSAILPFWGLKLLISYFKPLPKTPLCPQALPGYIPSFEPQFGAKLLLATHTYMYIRFSSLVQGMQINGIRNCSILTTNLCRFTFSTCGVENGQARMHIFH